MNLKTTGPEETCYPLISSRERQQVCTSSGSAAKETPGPSQGAALFILLLFFRFSFVSTFPSPARLCFCDRRLVQVRHAADFPVGYRGEHERIRWIRRAAGFLP